MRSIAGCMFVCLVFVCALPCGAADRVVGQISEIDGDSIVATFACPVRANSMLVMLAGEGEAVSGMAVSGRCRNVGNGSYLVTGDIQFVSDASSLATGKRVYVNSMNTLAPPAAATAPAMVSGSAPTGRPGDQDLKLYYFAAGQTTGYGALGLGYDRTVRVTKDISVEFDGAISGIGSVSDCSEDEVTCDQLIKSLSGKARFDFSPGFGLYSAYRWNEGRGDEDHWNDVAANLQGKTFIGASENGDPYTVSLRGIEYGISLRPARGFSLALGYIPSLRADYSSFGVRTEPGYAAELRFGTRNGAVRLRGLTSDDYWTADLGITIR